jgi:putative phosphoribosyl transferase
MTPGPFRDREDAGRQLAARLAAYREEEPVVLALPRGGVPVAFEVARALGAPLDVLVARKLGAPMNPEYALGAIAEGGALVVDRDAVAEADVSEAELAGLVERERAELSRRVRAYRGDRPIPDVAGRTAILVDDGIATGRTATAALRSLRARRPRRLVLATPVAAADTAAALRREVDELVCLREPEHFFAVGSWYEHFGQTTDDEVRDLLERSQRGRPGGAGSSSLPAPA